LTPDDPIVRVFVERSRVARIATRSAKGWPALAPLWFVEVGGCLWTTTGAATLAARNAAATPRVAVLLDAEAGGHSAHVLRLHGRAAVHCGLPSLRVLAEMARKYYVGGFWSELGHAAQWGLRRRYYAQGEAVMIEIEPERAELLRRPRSDRFDTL
jgi:hypothetical protein